MAEWVYEAGIGEARAALIEAGRILEMAIEPDSDVPRAGAILAARLARRADGSGRGEVTLDDGSVARLSPVPPGLTEGARLMVEVVREVIPEADGWKPAIVRAAREGALPVPGPDLRARLAASGIPLRELAPGPDLMEAHGWSEEIEEAVSGIVARPQAMLRLSLTPAMLLIDVDGMGAPAALAVAGAALAGETIRRFAVAGSIGIDLPTMAAKADRQAAAAALDAALPPPFERTAVNGFGFLQIVRRRVRPSLIEQLAADPPAAAARALLRRAERASGHGAVTIEAAPAVIARLAARPDWQQALARRLGAALVLREAANRPIWAGHAQRAHN